MIAHEAAGLLASGREHDYTDAKRRAARILGVRFSADDFPSTREIRDALQRLEELRGGAHLVLDPRRMALHALRLMRQLRPAESWLVGALVSGQADTGLETAVWVQSESLAKVLAMLDQHHTRYVVVDALEGSARDRRGVVLVPGEYIVKLIVAAGPPTESIPTPLPSCSASELHDRLAAGGSIESELAGIAAGHDRFDVIEELAGSLEHVKLDRREHPEHEALFHALQLFDLVHGESPYDEELLTAALLHDVGRVRSQDESNTDAATLLQDLVTYRTLRLIEAMELIGDGPLPTMHQCRALVGSENLEDLLLLVQLDRQARRPGVATTSLEGAVAILRTLDTQP
jgi:hypothetical protein